MTMTVISRRRFSFSFAAVGAAHVLHGLSSSAANAIPASPSSKVTSGLSLSEVSRMIRENRVTPTELTEACLARIETYNPKLDAFITVLRQQALEQAHVLDQEQAAGNLRGP